MSAMAPTAGRRLLCLPWRSCTGWRSRRPVPGYTVYHAVQEEGVSAKEIAETIGAGLKVPVVSITPEEAPAHFGWLAGFAGLDMPASSEWTRKALGWDPVGPGLIEDLRNMEY